MTPPVPPDWPMAAHSRIVDSRPHRWHVQRDGTGPTLLMLHGAGGATQSWRDLWPLLDGFDRVAVDLPGQGFTRSGARGRHGLSATAQDVSALLSSMSVVPDAILGHSAGTAIGLHMALDRPVPIVGINAALQGFEGVAGWLFPAVAKLLSLNPLTAPVFAATVTDRSTERLLEGTGSRIDARGRALYRRLASDRAHVDATLAMMAQWDLDPLLRALPGIEAPVTLITGRRDQAVPPRVSAEAAEALPHGTHVDAGDWGHLIHEEAPEVVAPLIHAALERT
ncbi:MAG: alpha/beta fold hydrolase BchO [Paracoccaceae bacterium]